MNNDTAVAYGCPGGFKAPTQRPMWVLLAVVGVTFIGGMINVTFVLNDGSLRNPVFGGKVI
jgi:hypothetical protein